MKTKLTTISLLLGITLVTPKISAAFEMSELSSRFASWGISPVNTTSSINLKNAWTKYDSKKISKNVIVAVIDTGIDFSHPFLKNNHYVVNGSASASNYGKDFSKGKKSLNTPNDNHGHGTHIAGIIKSIHPNVKILSLKYYNPQASGQDNLNSTLKALKYAVDQNVDIINYSGGGPEASAEEKKILKRARAKGILVVAASGNESSNIDKKENAFFPASYGYNNIITVTAHDQNKKVLSSSNYGKKGVDIAAPGKRIKSALPKGRAGYLTGTSQATAFVTGVAALIKAKHSNLTAAQIKHIIMTSSHKELTLMSKCSTAGRLDAAAALKLAGSNNGRIIASK